MNRALCWKEWREHRLVWLAVAVLAVIVLEAAVVTLAPAGSASLARDDGRQNLLLAVLLVLGVTYSLVCGGMMFAGEHEAGTQAFLDMLAGQRFTVWRTKVLVGVVLTVAQALVLLVLGLVTGLFPDLQNFWLWGVFLILFCLATFAWGILASTLSRTALGAACLGALFLFGSWIPVVAIGWAVAIVRGSDARLELIVAEGLVSLGAVIVSRRVFCRADLERRLSPARLARRQRASLSAWKALVWLSYQQGRALLIVLAVAAPLLGALVPFACVILWPTVTLIVGVLCGSAIFAGEQRGPSYRFLANLRLPLGKVWAVKTLFWLAVTAGVSVLVFLGALLRVVVADWDRSWSSVGSWGWAYWLQQSGLTSIHIPAPFFFPLWGVYGFCAGLLFAQLLRKPVIGVPLAMLVSAALAALSMPSLLLGGVHFWQVLALPFALLLASRLIMGPWVGERMRTWKPLAALLGCAALGLAWTAGGLWYRATEIPGVDEPFDVRAYIASLPTPEQNEAGRLILRAAQELEQQEHLFNPVLQAQENPGPAGQAPSEARINRYEQLGQVLKKGWSAAKPGLGQWLDKMFEGEWAKDYDKAAGLPLAVVRDPRTLNRVSLFGSEWRSSQAAALFTGRALQRQARGDAGKALEDLLAVLSLSRQLRHRAVFVTYRMGNGMEAAALDGLDQWLRRLGPREELLWRALRGLNWHEAAIPPVAEAVKAEYFMVRNSLSDWASYTFTRQGNDAHQEKFLIPWALEAPWEKERARRLMNALVAGQLAVASRPVWEDFGADRKDRPPLGDSYERIAHNGGLDVNEETARALTPRQWGRLLLSTPWTDFYYFGGSLARSFASSRCRVRAARLQIALALYQIEHGRPAASLQDLVPNLLTEVPLDPFTGQPFHYRVSKGERLGGDRLVAGAPAGPAMEVRAGQGLLWCEGEAQQYYLVPMWPKR